MFTRPSGPDPGTSSLKDGAPAPIDPSLKFQPVAASAPAVIRRRKPKPKERYVIERLIGQGGMGAVYKARDLELNRTVALKLLHPSISLDANSESRLKRELVVASKVSHRHVVRVYDFGEIRGTKFISMAFIDGENLKSLIVREGTIPIPRAVHIAVQLCKALKAAQAVSVVHRDLKPQNILLDGNGNVYVSDFGLAKSSADSNSEVTMPGERPGSPAYMSPEQALGLPVDHRSDLYSFGLVFYEMVTGKPPAATNAPFFEHERFRCKIKSPSLLNPEVSEDIAGVILRCLEFDPAKRYQTAADVLKDLNSQPASDRATTGPPQPRSRYWILFGALAALTIIGAVMLFSTTPSLPGKATTVAARTSKPARRLAFVPFRVIGNKTSLTVLADTLTEAVSSRAGESGRVRLFMDAVHSAAGSPVAVDAVVGGSVRAAGNEVLVTIHIADGASGEETWTRQFRADPEKLLGLEEQIWEGITRALGLQASTARATPALLHATKNLEAYKLYMQGKLVLEMHRNPFGVEQAVPLFHEALKHDPNYFSPYLGLADAYLIMVRRTHDNTWLEKARQATSRAEDLSPDRPEALTQVAKIQIASGQYPEAIRLLNEALEMNPASDDAYRTLGKGQLLSGHRESALAAYQKAVKLDSHSWRNHNALGSACFQLGLTEKAESAFQTAIQLEPEIDDNYTDLGSTYLQAGRFQDAVPLFEKAVKLQPDAINYSNLGTALFYLRQYEGAVSIFQKAVTLDSGSEELMGNLADAYRWSNQKDKATEIYFRAAVLGSQSLNLNPKDAGVRGRIAVYYAKMGDLENARASIRSAREMDPANASLVYYEAVILALASDYEQAKQKLHLALSNGYPRSLAINDPELQSLYPQRGKGR